MILISFTINEYHKFVFNSIWTITILSFYFFLHQLIVEIIIKY